MGLSDSGEYPICNAYTRWALFQVKVRPQKGWEDIHGWVVTVLIICSAGTKVVYYPSNLRLYKLRMIRTFVQPKASLGLVNIHCLLSSIIQIISYLYY